MKTKSGGAAQAIAAAGAVASLTNKVRNATNKNKKNLFPAHGLPGRWSIIPL